MKFTISSHKDYIDKTEEKLYSSLINSGIHNDDIYIFVGGYGVDYGYNRLCDVRNKFSVPHNSMDFTGLISVLELDLESDYWFLLHDTCYVGPNFYNYIKSFNHNNKSYISLTFDVSMNIGSYSWPYLLNKKNHILQYKNTSNNLQEYKAKLIREEDIFLKPKTNFYCNKTRSVNGPIDYYNNNTPRIIEYFHGIDFYKIKANWQLKRQYTLKI